MTALSEGVTVTEPMQPRERKVKILATLGPASNTPEMIEALMRAGADAFRINMSHGEQADKVKLVQAIRALEPVLRRPTTIVFDLQGPKLRVGNFAGGSAMLEEGTMFVLDDDDTPGSAHRVELPHPELFAAARKGDRLLIDDGKVRLKIAAVEPGKIGAIVEVGGKVSNHKGVNVPDVLVPIPALTEKDRSDLQFALEQGADYIALSFVQRPEDVAEARELIGDRAGILSKIEKPQAIERLDEILKLSDAVMVARGDLGVELPPESVPPLQNKIVARARQLGKPVVVATQMLEFDDRVADTDPGRGERRRNRHLRRRRRGHAVGRKRGRAISDRGGDDDGSHRPQRRARPGLRRAGPLHGDSPGGDGGGRAGGRIARHCL